MYYGFQHYPQYKAVIHHRELAIAVQLFRHITDALAAKAVAFFLGHRQAVPQLRSFGKGILDGNEQLVFLHAQVQLDIAFFRRQLFDRVDSIFQRVGENGGQIHLGIGQFLRYLHRVFELDAAGFDLFLVGGEDQIDYLIFAVTLGGGIIGGGDDLADEFLRLFGLAIFDVAGNIGEEVAHIMPQDGNFILGAFDCLDLFFGLSTLHFHQLVAQLRFPFFLILLKVHEQEQDVGDAQHKAQKFRYDLPAGIQQRGIYAGDIIKHIVD